MASIASTSTVQPSIVVTGGSRSTPTVDECSPGQAEPLPRKRGEIGFVEGTHEQASPANAGPGASTLSLPARHPHERSTSPDATLATGQTNSPATSPSNDHNQTDSGSTHSAGKRSLISFLSAKKLPRILGVTAATFARFLIQFFVLGGTIAAWGVVAHRISKSTRSTSSSPADMFGTTAPIFVHVAFGIVTLAQALLLDRVVFRMRAERYLFLHPGELLPQTMAREVAASGNAPRNVLGLAPWNRPPVPTYAAALSETGIRGTGDVEDGLIAQPPPPAYGKTRGSMMLLSGPMSTTLREQARLARTGSLASHVSERSDRPLSYMSHDSAWDERVNAGRALALEETLSQLERGGDSHQRRPSQDSTRTVMPALPPPAVLPARDESLLTVTNHAS